MDVPFLVLVLVQSYLCSCSCSYPHSVDALMVPLPESDNLSLQDSPFYSEAFYPGQMIAGPSRAFKEVKWLSGSKPILHTNAQVKATVEEV